MKEIKFDGLWGKLEAKNCFQIRSFTEYLRQTLVFMSNSKIPEGFNFYLSSVFF